MPLSSSLSAPLSPTSGPSSSSSSSAAAASSSSSSSSMLVILILGGWSHGPLNYLKYGRHRNCIFLEPSIPMPPMHMKFGHYSWSDQCIMVMSFIGILGITIYGWSHVIPTLILGIMTSSSNDANDNNNNNNNNSNESNEINHYETKSSSSSIFLLLFLARFSILILSLTMIRIWVAWIVRRSMARGVAIAKPYLKDVDIVIGFSWGGAVVAELIRLGFVGNSAWTSTTITTTSTTPTNQNQHGGSSANGTMNNKKNNNHYDATTTTTTTNSSIHHDHHHGAQKQPLAMLIAPTTALISQVAMQTHDAASVIRIPDSRHVHVFHGIQDQKTVYCPHGNRWKNTGVTLHWCDDNHVFLRKQSIQALTQTLDDLIRMATTDSSCMLSSPMTTGNNSNATTAATTTTTNAYYKGGSIRCV